MPRPFLSPRGQPRFSAAARTFVLAASALIALLVMRTGRAEAFGAQDGASTARRSVVYTPAQWPKALEADLYVPPTDARIHPAVVTVHGGGWNGRDREDMRGIGRALAERGFVVLNIDYRLAPEFHHPAPVEDVRAAVSYLREHARELHVDPDRIGGWGYSAGAQLVTLAANSDHGAVPLMRALVAGGMPADFRRYPQSPIIAEYIGSPYEQARAAWEAASPILHVSPDDPPMFLYQGNGDRIVEPAELVAMRAELERNGVEVEVRQVPLLGHIATFLLSRASRRDAIDFLARRLNPSG